MKTRLSTFLFWFLILAAPIFGQQGPYTSTQYNVAPSAPVPPVTSATVTQQQGGTATYYYWIVSNNSPLYSQPSGPFFVTNAPATLSATAYNTVNWTPVTGVTSYDVLRTASSTVPTGACGCAVATGVTLTTVEDISNTLNAYTVNAMGSQYQIVNNVVSGVQTLQQCYQGVCTTLGGSGNSSGVVVNNVQNFGATGKGKFSFNVTTTNGSSTVTDTTDAPFLASDVGSFMECNKSGADAFNVARTTITAFVSATQVTVATTGNANAAAGSACVWSPTDDTLAFQQAEISSYTALLAASSNVANGTTTLATPPKIYIPHGVYLLSGPVYCVFPGATKGVVPAFVGDGPTVTTLIWGQQTGTASGIAFPTSSACSVGLANTSGIGVFVNQSDSFEIGGFTATSLNFQITVQSNSGFFYFLNQQRYHIHDMQVQDLPATNGTAELLLGTGSQFGYIDNLFMQNSGIGGTIPCGSLAGAGHWRRVTMSNCAPNGGGNLNAVITGGARTPNSEGLVIDEYFGDECGFTSGNIGCTSLVSCQCTFIGSTFLSGFSGVPAVSVDGASIAVFNSSNIGAFNSANNVPGIYINSGGIAESAGSTLRGNGTAVAIEFQSATSVFVDNGGNFYQNWTGSTCNNSSPPDTVNCNGKPADTLALAFSGGFPTGALTHTWNTCYDSLATFSAVTLCNQFADQNLQIIHIKAASAVTTSCTTAPVITITDGVSSATLTLTTAKASWDSSVDASSGINGMFLKGNTITVSNTAGTCATPPTNLSVTYNMQSLLNF
jgi:hypothetical protein